jgi:hypothetical protein
MTTRDHRPLGEAGLRLRPEHDGERGRCRAELPQGDDADFRLSGVEPADVTTVRQAFRLSLAELAAIFGIDRHRREK